MANAKGIAAPADAQEVARLLKTNEELRASLDAVRRTADELSERIRSLLEAAAEEDAERHQVSNDIRHRLKPPRAVSDERARRTRKR